MAARYWIGGTGNWSDTAHWSATSGGVGGASVPTSDDDVYFDSNSGTGTVTVNTTANMRDCTFAQTQLITLANAAYAFNIYGNWTLCSNTYLNTSFTGTGYVYLKATNSVNITSNGCTRAWNRFHFDGIGGEFVLIDNCILNAYLLRGTLNVNGNKLTGFIRNDGGSPTQSGFNLDNSSFEGSLFFNSTAELFFFSAINSIVDIINYCRAPKNTRFNIINYKSNSYSTADGNIDGLKYIDVLNIYSSNNTISVTYITNDFEVRLLNIFGTNSTNYRALFSSHFGTPRTITCNGTVTASNVDFRDIVGAGTANWNLSAIEGGSGDCGGNNGITFTPAQKQYFKHTSGAVNFSDTTKWFSDFSPRTTVGRVPLPQDDWDMDASSFTGTSTITVNCPRIGKSHNLSNVDQSISILLVNSIDVYGSLIWGNNVSVSGGTFIYLFGRTNYDINTYNKPIPNILSIESDSCFYTLKSNLTINGSLRQSRGTIDFNDYDCSASWYLLNTCYLGNGTITELYGGGGYGFDFQGTVYAENSTIKLSPTGSGDTPFRGKSNSFNKVQFSGAHTGNFDIAGNNTISELIIDSGRKVRFTNGTTQIINKLTAIGTPNQPITIGSTTAGQRHTINYTGSEASTVEYCNVSDSAVVQADKLYALNSVDGGNNVNWIFIVGYKMYSGANRVLKAYLGNTLLKNIYLGNESII